jgi:F-type H+-transporting ATPase subunit a
MKEAIEIHFINPTIVMMIIDYLILFTIVILGCINIKIKPGKAQNLVEYATKFICDLADEIIGHDAHHFYPLFILFFFYILIGNVMGLIPGLFSPTSKLSVTVALALIVFFYEHYVGIKKRGIINYFKHFAGEGVPGWIKPFMFFIEIISELARPISLSFRLFGNILAKEILLSVLVMLILIFFPSTNAIQKSLTVVPLILRPLILVLGTLVSLIQAGVFTMLAMIYVAGAVKSH